MAIDPLDPEPDERECSICGGYRQLHKGGCRVCRSCDRIAPLLTLKVIGA